MSKHVKFKSKGKWAEVNPALPQFEVKAGEIKEVSSELADVIEDAGRGEIVKVDKPKASEDDKGKGDKASAEKGKGK